MVPTVAHALAGLLIAGVCFAGFHCRIIRSISLLSALNWRMTAGFLVA
jgi:hypothetical protein